MTLEEARTLVQAYLKAKGQNSVGLNDAGLGGFDLGPLRIRFVFSSGRLKVIAPAYRFRKPPKEGRVERYLAEFGKVLRFEKTSQTLMFQKSVRTPDVKKLAEAIGFVAAAAEAFPFHPTGLAAASDGAKR